MSWAEIKHSVNSDLDKPLNELILELLSAGGSAVKGVQRGVATGNATVVISEIDVSKSVVLLNGGIAYSSGSGNVSARNATVGGGSGYISNITSTSFTIAGAELSTDYHTLSCTNSWQVIEFY